VNPADFFTIEYVPEKLLFRDEKVRELLRGTYPKLVFGKSGTGKTLTARWMDVHGLATYLKCSVSLYATLQPMTGYVASSDAAAAVFFNSKIKEPVIFDDVDTLAKHKKIELDYALKLLADNYGSAKYVLITRMKPQEFFYYLREDVANRYRGCEAVVFEDYTIDQIKDILRQRFEAAGIEPPNRHVLEYLAFKYNAGTPLREIFRVLRVLIADRTPITVEAAEEGLKEGAVHDFMKEMESMPIAEACLLGAVAKCQHDVAKRYSPSSLYYYDDPKATRPHVYETYNQIAKQLPGMDAVSYTTLNGLVSELEEMSYIRTEPGVAPGGKGRTTYISCVMNYRTVLKSFKLLVRRKYSIDDVFSDGE
jgi:Cdc6-like AAA superfamily ATPase